MGGDDHASLGSAPGQRPPLSPPASMVGWAGPFSPEAGLQGPHTHSLCDRSSEEPPWGPSSEVGPSSGSLSSGSSPFCDAASPLMGAEKSG